MTFEQVANPLLGPSAQRPNLLTNGGMELWQRGNGPFTGSVWACDRWQLSLGGTSTMSVSKDTTNQDTGSQACAAVTYTQGTGGSFFLNSAAYAADGGLVQQLRGKQVSFSVRVKTSTASAVAASIYGTVLGNHVYGAPHTGNGTYQTLTVTVTVPATETNLQVEVQFTASCTAYLDNAMLVVGAQPCDYVPMHPADDLARCLRYYELVGPSGSYPQLTGYVAAAGQNVGQSLPLAAKKAVTPTTTVMGTFNYSNATALSSFNPCVSGIYLQIGGSAAGQVVAYSNNSGYIAVEANP